MTSEVESFNNESQLSLWKLSKSRVTINDKIYFQPTDDKAVMVETVFSFDVESDEQLYQRGPVKLKSGWQSIIDGCWIKPIEVGVIVISNCEGKNLQKIPSKAEIVEMENRIVEVYIRNSHERISGDFPEIDENSTFILIHPKDSQRLRVTNVSDIFVRPRIPGIRVKYFISPK